MRKMVHVPESCSTLGFGRTKFYAAIKDGLVPPLVPITVGRVGLPSDELQTLVDARVAGLDDDGVRRLVVRMVERRKELAAALEAA